MVLSQCRQRANDHPNEEGFFPLSVRHLQISSSDRTVHPKFPLSKTGHRPPKRGLRVVAIRRANCLQRTHQAVTGKQYGAKYANKAAVLGMLDRESRQVRAKVVRDTKRETRQKEIMKNVKFGSRVYTDMAVA
jgi:hypothetical protein